MVSGCGAATDLKMSRRFQQAQAAFDSGKSPADFLRAAALYQEILDSGFVSGAVFYNQGNAFMRAGQRGRAIAAYRQAQRYRPRDPYLEANLQAALGSQPTRPAASLIDYVVFWKAWLSYPEKFQATGALAGLTFIFGIARLFSQRRSLFSRLGAASFALTLVLGFSAGYDWYRFESIEHGVIIRNDVIARKGNAASYEPAFTESLSEGTEFEIVERRGNWILIRLTKSQAGWVEEESVVVF